MAAANAQIGVAYSAFYPALTLSASLGGESSAIKNLLEWPSRFWSVGPAISETVYDGGLRRAAVNQYIATYNGNVAAYRQSVLTAFQQVEDCSLPFEFSRSRSCAKEKLSIRPGCSFDSNWTVRNRHRSIYRCGHRAEYAARQSRVSDATSSPANDRVGSTDRSPGRWLGSVAVALVCPDLAEALSV